MVRKRSVFVIAAVLSATAGVSVASANPARVTLIAPSGSTPTTTPTFTWSADAEATYYLLRVIDWTGTTIDRWYTPAAAGCVVARPH